MVQTDLLFLSLPWGKRWAEISAKTIACLLRSFLQGPPVLLVSPTSHAFLEMTPNIALRAVKNVWPEGPVIVSPAWVSPVGEDVSVPRQA